MYPAIRPSAIRAGKRGYGLRVWGSEKMLDGTGGGAYPQLMTEVIKFFQTGVPPVSAAETIEILAFMEAADESKRRGGAPVLIAETIRAAGGE